MASEPLLAVEDLAKHFPIEKGLLRRVTGQVRAVDGVSFSIERGETLALVGESGCGKTTVARCILRLIEPSAGRVRFADRDVMALDRAGLRGFRRDAQIIFQDPFSSLNPRMTVGSMLHEVLAVHGLARNGDRAGRIAELLEAVGLDPADARKYPHQFSGGQRQRVVIARALAVEPQLIVADEPVSALDVSVQAQVLNLLADLQERFDLTYLFVSHDLSVVRQIADRVAVMYLGKIVELQDCESLFSDPLHPYTEGLLSSISVVGGAPAAGRRPRSGELPSPANPPAGCPFHPRCPHPAVDETCRTVIPVLEEKEGGGLGGGLGGGQGGGQAACHKVEKPKNDALEQG